MSEFTNTDFERFEEKLDEHVSRNEFEREWNRMMQGIQGMQQQVETLRQAVSLIAVIQERQIGHKEEMLRLTSEVDKLYSVLNAVKEKLDTWVARFGGAMGLLSLLMMAAQLWSMVGRK